MSRLGGLLARFRETVQRRRSSAELDEEIRFHLEREAERLARLGIPVDEARRRAAKAFGSPLHIKEQVRIEAGFPWFELMLKDFRYAARGLYKNPGFAAAAVLTLALGIGATTAVYTLVDHVLLRPLPYPAAEELVRIVQQNSPTNRWNLSVADVLGIEELQGSFESVAALEPGSVAFTGRGRPEQVAAGRVTAEWFRTLGVDFEDGRGFVPEDGVRGSPHVVVIGDAFRRRTFAGDETPIGASITLDGVPHTVVGVLAESWRSQAGYEADVWPILYLETPTRRGPFGIRGVARLNPGATLETARDDLDSVSRRLFPRWADGFGDENARLTPYALQESIVGDVRADLWFVFAAVLGVLLIAVANVSNLLLSRATTRQPELALRASLGASRLQIARQLLTESLLLAAVGGTAALAVAWGSIELLTALEPAVPRLDEVALDGPVLAVSAAITLAATLLFGMAPLAHAVSKKSRVGMGGGRGSVRSGPQSGVLRSALVVIEFAVAFPLLAGAILLVGSLAELRSVHPGFDPDGLVSASISLPVETYAGYAEIQGFWTEALRRINDLPEVVIAGVGTSLPPDNGGETNNFDLSDRPVESGESEHVSLWSWASAEFLNALDVPLLAGRMIEPSDDGTLGPVAVVSESWASRYAPEGDAVGTQFYAGGDRSQAITVVGVVGDVKFAGLDSSDDAAAYEPFKQAQWRRARLLVRARGSLEDAITASRGVIASLDPTLPLAGVETMPERMAGAVSQPRQWTIMLGLFSVLGLVLSAIGAYGVLSYYVGSRSRELGIRMALGANSTSLRAGVLRRGMTLAGAGVAVGLVVSLVGARWIRSVIFGVSPTDPRILGLVGATLLTVALLACLLPALRATRVDPIRALRAE